MDEVSLLLVISVLLFSIGILIVLTRTHVVVVLMGVELVFNAANLNLIAFNRLYPDNLSGQWFVIFVMVVAAAEAAVALAIVLRLYKQFKTIHIDQMKTLKEK